MTLIRSPLTDALTDALTEGRSKAKAKAGPRTATRARGRRGIAGALLAVSLAASGPMIWTGAANAHDNVPNTADLVQRVAPAVVYIEVTGAPREQSAEAVPNPFGPGGPLERFFGQRGAPQPQGRAAPERSVPTGVGSGFIIDGNGEIVTNNHVVAGATHVTVKLTDGRSFEAKVLGADPLSDLALIKITDEAQLPHVSFGDSDKMRPGDPVIAVGNPFGLGGTVTTGIVSAMSRNIHAGPYDDYIQTDAAINHGNSGGPLFNHDGDVIGVNSAIVSPTGGSVGIGFAVPSSIAQSVIAQIRETGGVERGWLGVRIQPVTPELADALGLEKPTGALVADVTADSPAAKAGVRQGDVIVTFDGHEVGDMAALPRLVAAVKPGAAADLEAVRRGETLSLSVEIGTLGADQMAAAETTGGPVHEGSLGVELAMLDDAARAALNLPDEASGVLVASVDPDGAAAEHLMRGDLVISVDGAAVRTPAEMIATLEGRGKAKAALLVVNRQGTDLFVGIRLKQA